MTRQTECKKMLNKLELALVRSCFEGNVTDFKSYIDADFKVYFNDVFYKPISFLRFPRSGTLLTGFSDGYKDELIKSLTEFKNISTFIYKRYRTKKAKRETIILNYAKFTLYYLINLNEQIMAWNKSSPESLNQIISDFLDNPEDINSVDKRLLAIKRYSWTVFIQLVSKSLQKTFINDLTNKKVLSILRYEVPDIDIEKTITIKNKFSVLSPTDTPRNESGLLNIGSNKNNAAIELPIYTDYSFSKEDIHSFSYTLFIGKHFTSFKYRENAVNSLILFCPADLKIEKEAYYLKTFQTFKLIENNLKELGLVPRITEPYPTQKIIINQKNRNKISLLSTLVEPISDFNPKDKNFECVMIAMDFLKDALSKKTRIQRVAYCIQALEALYNTQFDQISRSVSQRVSLTMSLLKEAKPKKYRSINPVEIYDETKKAYVLRSKYVHGAGFKAKVSDEHINHIFYYTKTSIILFLYLIKKFNYNKDDINKKLDECLLCKNSTTFFVKPFKEMKVI